MSTQLLAKTSTKDAAPSIDLAGLARRTVVVIAAGAGVLGIVNERPVEVVALRAGAVAVIGIVAIALTERIAARLRPTKPRRAQREVR